MSRTCATALALLVVISGGCAPSGRGGDAGRKPFSLSWEQEIELGRQVAPALEETRGGRCKDLAVQAYVRSIGERLSRSTAHPDLPYQFAVLDSAAVSAFSLPGGPVCVTRGLLAHLSTEGELAAVLSHEMAHVNARHTTQAIGRQTGLAVLFEVIGTAASRSGADGGATRYPGCIGKVVRALIGLRYNADEEREADRSGLDSMVAAGYDPGEWVRLLKLFESSEGSKAVEWSVTHPNPESRAETAQSIIRMKYPDRRGRVGEEEYKREVLRRLLEPKA